MSRVEVGDALPVVSLVGILGLFLPGYDAAWEADPGDEDFRKRLRAGECAYVTTALALGLLASYAQDSAVPLLLTATWAALAIGMHEYALNHR